MRSQGDRAYHADSLARVEEGDATRVTRRNRAAQIQRLFAPLHQFHQRSTARSAFLELSFPQGTDKSPYATEQLHVLLQSVASSLSKTRSKYSLEIVSNHTNGIRYVIVIPQSSVPYVRRSLLAYLPGIKVRRVNDYLALSRYPSIGVSEFRLRSLYAFPIRQQLDLNEHDPMAYLTSHMTQLNPSECIALQLVVAPLVGSHARRIQRKSRQVITRIMAGEPLYEDSSAVSWHILAFKLPLLLLEFIGELIAALIVVPVVQADGQHQEGGTSIRHPLEFEQISSVKTKLEQPLYDVSLRVLVGSASLPMAVHRTNTLVAALRTYSTQHQAIVPCPVHPVGVGWQSRRRIARFSQRAIRGHGFGYGMVLSSSELADLYHFPNTKRVHTDGLLFSRVPELPVPLSMRQNVGDLDVVLGTNRYGGREYPIGQTLTQRQKHTYIIGKTGMGKTTLLTAAIHQDMVQGRGLAVLDPHGDMYHQLLKSIPKHRLNDVVLFDPADRNYPVGLNLLDPGVPFANEEDKHEWIASAVVSVFAKLADAAYWGPRMEHILRNVTLTALKLPDPTFYTIQRLLTDRRYQRRVTSDLSDPILRQFWQKELSMYGNYQLAAVTAPLTHRLGHFITATMSRNILLQAKTSIRLSTIMDEGKILLANLSKGDIGEDQSAFFGTLLTSLIWMAAYQRVKLPEEQRRDFFLYIDEFQNFATSQFADITSEGRKFHVALVAAHQNIAQISNTALLKTISGNAHTIISFQSNPDDEAFLLPYMEPAVEKGHILNLPPHTFFMKTTTDQSEGAFTGTTVPLVAESSESTREQAVAHSREAYATPRKTIEKRLEKLLGPISQTRTTKPAVKKRGL